MKWFTRTVLVLGLITFSGHISEQRSNNYESTKIELAEARKVSSKKTVHFKKTTKGFHGTIHLAGRAERYVSYLLRQGNMVAIKLKGNFKERPNNYLDKSFLLYHASVKSKEFGIDQIIRG